MERDPEGPVEHTATGGGFAGTAWRHRVLISKIVLAGLIVVVILQNLEPTDVDLLFWSLPEVPKLVMILVSMVVGAGAWEIVRRAIASAWEE